MRHERRGRSRRAPRAATTAALAVLFLVGCRPEEQDRVIDFDPGVYKGQEDNGLSQEQYEELRSRARLQAGV